MSRLVPEKGYKVFRAKGMTCEFCSKVGHERRFCPHKRVRSSRSVFSRDSPEFAFAKDACDSKGAWVRDHRKSLSLSEVKSQLSALADELDRDNPWRGSTDRGDDLKKHVGMWRAIGAPMLVRRWIVDGVPVFPERDVPRMGFENGRSCDEQIEFVESQMEKWRAAGAYAVVRGRDVHVSNPLLVAPKKSGEGWRLILDARYPNSFLPKLSFKLSTVERDVAACVRKGDELFTVDISSAYYSVPLHPSSQKYMGWKFRGKHYVSRVLPFGLTLAPYAFTKVVKPIVKFLQSLGIRVVNYMDDFVFACYPDKANETAEFVLWLFRSLGWQFSDKTALSPSDRATFLGVTVDSKEMMFEALPEKVRDVAERVSQCLKRASVARAVPRSSLASLTGKIISMRMALPSANVWTQCLSREASRQKGEGDASMSVDVLEELRHWRAVLSSADPLRMPIRAPESEIELRTDASVVGWGAHMRDVRKSGWFPREMVNVPTEESSAARELSALLCAAHEFRDQLRGRRVRVVMDSKAAICNLTNGGGPVPALCGLVKRWYSFCEEFRVAALSYVWVPREDNKIADTLSKAYGSKWDVSRSLRALLERDDRTTLRSLEEGGPDLLAPDWNDVASCVERCRRTRARTYLIVPNWPSRSWWPAVVDAALSRREVSFDEAFIASSSRTARPSWSFTVFLCDFSRLERSDRA